MWAYARFHCAVVLLVLKLLECVVPAVWACGELLVVAGKANDVAAVQALIASNSWCVSGAVFHDVSNPSNGFSSVLQRVLCVCGVLAASQKRNGSRLATA